MGKKKDFIDAMADMLCSLELPDDAPYALKAEQENLKLRTWRDKIFELVNVDFDIALEEAHNERCKKLYEILKETNNKLNDFFNGTEKAPEETPKENQKFYVGQLVRIKSWAKMAREFGVAKEGFIQTPEWCFCDNMSYLCGKEAKIISLKRTPKAVGIELEFKKEGLYTDYHYTTDMIEPV